MTLALTLAVIAALGLALALCSNGGSDWTALDVDRDYR